MRTGWSASPSQCPVLTSAVVPAKGPSAIGAASPASIQAKTSIRIGAPTRSTPRPGRGTISMARPDRTRISPGGRMWPQSS